MAGALYRVRLGFVLAFGIVLWARQASAQEFQPRTYSVAPVNLNFIGIGYAYARGGLLLDPSLPIENADGDFHVALGHYVRTLDVGGLPSRVKVAVPGSSGHWEGLVDGQFRTRDATGLGDVRVTFETLFHGAPVMSPAQMRGYRPRTIFGARLQIIAPTGEYDSTKALNLGANRWGFIPEVGMSTPLGKWSLEAALGVWLFTENDDFFGGHRLDQQPLLVAKLHAIRNLRPGFWWALAGGFGYGARTEIDGVERETIQRNWRLFAIVAYAINPRHGIHASVGTGRNAGIGADYDAVTVGYQFAWGKGMPGKRAKAGAASGKEPSQSSARVAVPRTSL